MCYLNTMPFVFMARHGGDMVARHGFTVPILVEAGRAGLSQDSQYS